MSDLALSTEACGRKSQTGHRAEGSRLTFPQRTQMANIVRDTHIALVAPQCRLDTPRSQMRRRHPGPRVEFPTERLSPWQLDCRPTSERSPTMYSRKQASPRNSILH